MHHFLLSCCHRGSPDETALEIRAFLYELTPSFECDYADQSADPLPRCLKSTRIQTSKRETTTALIRFSAVGIDERGATASRASLCPFSRAG